MCPKETGNYRWGVLCAVVAQVLWGFFPVYFHFLKKVGAVELVGHRAIWSFVCLMVLVLAGRAIKPRFDLPAVEEIRSVFNSPGLLRNLAIAAVLIAINWLTFVWAVNSDHKIDASLGYYICPQVIVLLGVVFLGERLSFVQWIAFALAVVGVFWIAQSDVSVPWVGLTVAFSFGLYALIKKIVPVSSLVGLTFEMGFLLLPAIGFLLYRGWPLGNTLIGEPWWFHLLLIGVGPATVAPLAFYSTAVKHIPLSTVGLLQFIGPTIQFLIGTFVFHEPFDSSRLVGFAFVWIGVALFMFTIGSRGRTGN